jgi:hypothetical protein
LFQILNLHYSLAARDWRLCICEREFRIKICKTAPYSEDREDFCLPVLVITVVHVKGDDPEAWSH